MKLYDIAITEPATELSAAALMAKSGTKLETGYGAQPDAATIASQPPTATATAVPSAEIATPPATPNAEKGSDAQPKPTATPTPEPAAPQEDWRKVLKAQSHTDILKEMGADDDTVAFFNEFKSVDPKVKGLMNAWKSGDVKPYLEALSTDFGKMSDEEVMKYDLKQKYPEFDEADLKELYAEYVTDKYKLDPAIHTEDEIRRGKSILKANALEVRSKLEAARESKILPAAPPPQEDDSESRIQAFIADYRKKPEVVEYINSRKLTIGKGDDAFHLGISDPEKDLNVFLDPKEWTQAITKADVATQMLISRILNDKDGTIDLLINHGKSLGGREIIKPLENASISTSQPAAVEPVYETPAQAMAKLGKRS